MTLSQFLWGLVTWSTVIIGWMVVADQQAFRELRKDRATKLDEVRKFLDCVEHNAITFHTAAQFENECAFRLRRSLGMLSRELNVLAKCQFIPDSSTDAVIALRQACTNDGQDSRTFKQCDYFSEDIGRIMAARDALEDLLSSSLTQTILCNKPIRASLKDIFCNGWHWIVSVLDR
jgi:hypothetical protein